jgi:hypothetical protein
LFPSIWAVKFLQKSNNGSAGTPFKCALALTALTSLTERKNVNCQLRHHFVCHASARSMGACLQLLTSST